MLFRQLFDRESSTYTYLIADRITNEAILVDSVLEQVERELKLLKELNLTLKFCLETHIHADHITGTGKLRDLTGCQAIVPVNAQVNGADRFIKDGEIIKLGTVEIQAIETLGHTDSHMAYLVNQERVLTGDALLIRGCGRTDFQSGNAGTLYDSVTNKLFSLPDNTLVYPAHDYNGQTVSTIGEEKQWNSRFTGRDRANFIKLMNNLDLSFPKKIMEAVPANKSCGKVTVGV
ncbi:MAG: MBL fold metallo-hydrolase [Waterburya sp.]